MWAKHQEAFVSEISRKKKMPDMGSCQWRDEDNIGLLNVFDANSFGLKLARNLLVLNQVRGKFTSRTGSKIWNNGKRIFWRVLWQEGWNVIGSGHIDRLYILAIHVNIFLNWNIWWINWTRTSDVFEMDVKYFLTFKFGMIFQRKNLGVIFIAKM